MPLKYVKVWVECWHCKTSKYKAYTTSTCPMCKTKGGKWGKEQVMQCFGGPLKGKRTTEKEAGKDYVRYNPSCNSKPKMPCVLVHKELT
jgi:hypothetical protein